MVSIDAKSRSLWTFFLQVDIGSQVFWEDVFPSNSEEIVWRRRVHFPRPGAPEAFVFQNDLFCFISILFSVEYSNCGRWCRRSVMCHVVCKGRFESDEDDNNNDDDDDDNDDDLDFT